LSDIKSLILPPEKSIEKISPEWKYNIRTEAMINPHAIKIRLIFHFPTKAARNYLLTPIGFFGEY
jgi:hypothetical protein